MSQPEGRFEYARAHALFASSIARAGVDTIPVRRLRAISRQNRFPGLSERNRKEMTAITVAIDVLAELAQENPSETKYHLALARAYRDKSKVASRAGILGEASRSINQSVDHLESLLSQDRQSAPIRYELAKTLASSGEAFAPNQLRLFRLRRADTLSADLLKQSPALPRYQALRAHVLELLAQNLHRRGERDDARQKLGEALSLYDSLIERSPEWVLYRIKKSQALESFADLEMRAGDRAAASDYLQRAINESAAKGRSSNASPVARSQWQRQRQKLDRFRDLPESP
jgi:tetratricopeptide (TPR) repeat protein